LRKEKIGDSSGGVSSPCSIRSGLRENITEGGREPIPSFRGFAPLTGDSSEGGEGVSGEGVCQRGGVCDGVMLGDDHLLSFPESFLEPPKVDINERTRESKGESIMGFLPCFRSADQLTTRTTHDDGWISRPRISPSTSAGRVVKREIKEDTGEECHKRGTRQRTVSWCVELG
jgi:hypothetical protein